MSNRSLLVSIMGLAIFCTLALGAYTTWRYLDVLLWIDTPLTPAQVKAAPPSPVVARMDDGTPLTAEDVQKSNSLLMDQLESATGNPNLFDQRDGQAPPPNP